MMEIVWREEGSVEVEVGRLEGGREVELGIDLRIQEKSSLKLLKAADYKPDDWPALALMIQGFAQEDSSRVRSVHTHRNSADHI